MEWCRPVPADEAEALAARCSELTLRAEPAHQEAFLKIGDGQIGGADWEVVSRSLEAWSERQPDILPADLGLRIPISPAKQGRIPIKTSRSRLPVDHADTAVVQAESLTKRFGEVAAGHLRWRLGRSRAFSDPNGAGKTTTLRMILGLAAPTSGRALVFDHHYAELPRAALRIGAVLEATDFHPGRSGRDHLRMLGQAVDVPDSRAGEVLRSAGSLVRRCGRDRRWPRSDPPQPSRRRHRATRLGPRGRQPSVRPRPFGRRFMPDRASDALRGLRVHHLVSPGVDAIMLIAWAGALGVLGIAVSVRQDIN